MQFTDKDLKYLQNTQRFLSKAKFELTGEEILPIAATMTYIQGTLIPKVDAAVKDSERKQKLMEAKAPISEEPKPATKKKTTRKKASE